MQAHDKQVCIIQEPKYTIFPHLSLNYAWVEMNHFAVGDFIVKSAIFVTSTR